MKKTIVLSILMLSLLSACSETSSISNPSSSISDSTSTSDSSTPSTPSTSLPDPSIPKGESYETDAVLASFFASPYSSTATVTTSYDTRTYTAYDEVSSSERYTERRSSNTLLERHFYTSSSGDAYEEKLSLSNTVISTALVDSEDNNLSFADEYGNPFYLVTTEEIPYLFTRSNTSNGYIYSATEYGLSLLSPLLIKFYKTFDDMMWDTSVQERINNLSITTDSEGNPTTLNYSHVKVDRYGGIAEEGTVSLQSIADVTSLSPVTSSLTSEQSEAFTSAISEIYPSILEGNFTQHFNLTTNALGTNGASYNIYYDLPYELGSPENGLGLALSDLALYDSNEGETFTGLAYGWQGSEGDPQYGYWSVGVSPESQYMSTVSSEFYTSIASCTPALNTISPDFFTYEDGKYVFDLTSFAYNDLEFSLSIVDALFGRGDYLSAYSNQIYVNDMDTLSIAFQAVTVDLSSTPTFSLQYLDSNDELQETFVSFSDFGTTDLREVPALADAVETAMIYLW